MYRPLLLISLLLCLLSCKTTQVVTTTTDTVTDYYIADTDVTNLRAYPDSKEDKSITEMIAPYKVEMSKEMDITIGMLPQEIKKGKPNSSMGSWFCDILHEASERVYDGKVDFALQNYGGLRVPSVSKGPLSKGKVFEMMPFDNKLVILSLSTDQLRELCDLIASSGGWPVSYGLSMKMDRKKATDIKINGEAIEKGQTYNVAITDYIANGGGGADFLKELSQHDTGFFIRDVVIEQLEIMRDNGTPITVDNTKRIK